MALNLIVLVTFFAIVLLSLGVASAVLGRRRPPDEDETRLASETLWSAGAFHDETRAADLGAAEAPGFVRFLARLLPRRKIELTKVAHELGLAGDYRRAALTEFLALRNCLVLAVLIVTLMTALGATEDSDVLVQIVLVGLVVAVLA